MNPSMLFVVSSPRSGSTMLERMLESHSQIQGGPEPHILTPLAHLGVWDKVDKAPYDHVLAAESQKLFIEQLPQGEHIAMERALRNPYLELLTPPCY